MFSFIILSTTGRELNWEHASALRDRVPDMSEPANPHHVPDPAKRFQVSGLERAGQGFIQLFDSVEDTGISLPITSVQAVVQDIEDEVLRLIQERIGNTIEITPETLPIVEQLLIQQALVHHEAKAPSSPSPEDRAQDDDWRGDREDVPQRVVELMERPSHAIVGRGQLALQMVSEMALFKVDAQRETRGVAHLLLRRDAGPRCGHHPPVIEVLIHL